MSATGQPPGSPPSERRMPQLGLRRQPPQPVGAPIVADGRGTFPVPNDAIDPEQAIAKVLAAYLLSLTFNVNNRTPLSNPPQITQQFRLEEVFDEWPESDTELPYPCASILAPETAYDAHAFTPTEVEGTFGLYDVAGATSGTFLLKTAEVDLTYQVDIWTRDVAKREAVIARMQSAFAPEDNVSRVMLTGTPSYWNLPVRCALEGIRRVDTANAVYSHERRAVLSIRGTVSVVDLRCATLLDPGYRLSVGTSTELEES